MRSWTQLQYQLAMQWLERDMEEPSKSEWYLMAIARAVRSTVDKDTPALSRFKLEFGTVTESLKHATFHAHIKWLAAIPGALEAYGGGRDRNDGG